MEIIKEKARKNPDKDQHEMYLNFSDNSAFVAAACDKDQHEMYLNNITLLQKVIFRLDKDQHEMYLNPP